MFPRAAATEPTLGLIFPPLNYPIPPDAKALFPAGVKFIGNGVGLPGGMTVDSGLAFGETKHAFANDVELNLGRPTSNGGRTGAQKAELPGAVLYRPG